ncbi:MAG TPA: carboxymuconolactone decarboxylase family protein [Steroidobacteraceae bacterium]|nr:carboxymuconolactone decarboxylase family protein [Steroidobacteraceae bacterium]
MAIILFFRNIGSIFSDFQNDTFRPTLGTVNPDPGGFMAIPSDHGQRSFGDVAPSLAELTDRVLFDGVWQDPALSPRDRSLATVSALIALGRTEQLPFHLRRARDNGVSPEELAALVTHLAFYAGWPVAASAVIRLRELAQEEARP